MEQSIGEKELDVDFISGNNDTLQNCKEAFAHLYNRLEKIKGYKVKGDEITSNLEALELINLSQNLLQLSEKLMGKAIKLYTITLPGENQEMD